MHPVSQPATVETVVFHAEAVSPAAKACGVHLVGSDVLGDQETLCEEHQTHAGHRKHGVEGRYEAKSRAEIQETQRFEPQKG